MKKRKYKTKKQKKERQYDLSFFVFLLYVMFFYSTQSVKISLV